LKQILALDIATKTGWARWSYSERRPVFGVKVCDGGLGAMCNSFATWLNAEVDAHGITDIAIEAPVPQSGLTNLTVLMMQYGLHSIVHALCARRGMSEPLQVGVGQWRGHFIRVGRAPSVVDGKTLSAGQRRGWLKKRCVAECQSRGWPVKSDDAADALGVLDYARALNDPRYGIDSSPLFSGEAINDAA
jgi:hypothetical protein